MKRFIFSVLCVSVFFIGIGAIANSVSARFGSDEKALAIISQARLAIGGDAAIADVQNLVIKGSTTTNFELPDGLTKSRKGETEIALQLPDKFMKTMSISDGNSPDQKLMTKTFDVVVVRDGKPSATADGIDNGDRDVVFKSDDGKRIEIRRVAGEPAELEQQIIVKKGEKIPAGVSKGENVVIENIRGRESGYQQNELARMTLGLLLTPPEGVEVSYTFIGEETVDSIPVNVVNADVGGTSIKLYFSRLSSLPVMMSYVGSRMPAVFAFKTNDAPEVAGDKTVRVFTRTATTETIRPADSEIQIKFSDYRVSNGLQLPFKWTTVSGGKTLDVFDVASYEKNAANIADKFPAKRIFVKGEKATPKN